MMKQQTAGAPGMKRRTFIASVTALAIPLHATAQQSAFPVIGFLNGASYELSRHLVRAFHEGLAETGYVEGRNVTIEYRSGEGQYDRLPALAAGLAGLNVNVIVATGTPTGLPAKGATTSIPIVFVTGSDPIEQGLVTNLNRPTGNLTGATTLAVELGRKRMELLRELVPSAKLKGVPRRGDLHRSDPQGGETIYPSSSPGGLNSSSMPGPPKRSASPSRRRCCSGRIR